MLRFQGSVSVIQFHPIPVLPGLTGNCCWVWIRASSILGKYCITQLKELLHQLRLVWQAYLRPSGVLHIAVWWERWLTLTASQYDRMLMATSLLLGKEIGFVLFPLIKDAWTFVFNLLMQLQHSIAPQGIDLGQWRVFSNGASWSLISTK